MNAPTSTVLAPVHLCSKCTVRYALGRVSYQTQGILTRLDDPGILTPTMGPRPGILTPSNFSFSRMADRERLANLPGATMLSGAVNFSRVQSAHPGLAAARPLKS